MMMMMMMMMIDGDDHDAVLLCLVYKAQYTPPTRRNCRVASRRRCVHEFATIVGDSFVVSSV